MDRQMVWALANGGEFLRQKVGAHALILRVPGLTPVVGPEHARGRDRDEHPPWVSWIATNGMHHHAACTGKPLMPGGMIGE